MNVKKLPDSYAKDAQSNNHKLLNLNEQAIADVRTDAQAIYDSLDISKATGKTLELYGEMIGQPRGILNDAQYYYMILTKIGINGVQGNYTTVTSALANLFNCSPELIKIKDGEEDACVEVTSIPLEVLFNAGFTTEQVKSIIKTLMPIGVTVGTVNFNGTFEFAETANEYDETAGFADIAQTIGGYLGLHIGDDENQILPL